MRPQFSIFSSLLLLLIGCSFSSNAQPRPGPAERLVGIVNLPDFKLAILEFPKSNFGHVDSFFLKQGEQISDVEMLEIDPAQGSVKIKASRGAPTTTLSFSDETAADRTNSKVPPSLRIKDADIHLALTLYAQFADRNVLASPRLTAVSKLSVAASPANMKDAAGVLERLFLEHEVVTVPDGDNFVMVVTKGEQTKVQPRSRELKAEANAEVSAPGLVNFYNASRLDALLYYSEVKNGRMDRTEGTQLPPALPIVFKSQKPMTLVEIAYTLETLLSWQGVRPVQSANGWKLERIDQ